MSGHTPGPWHAWGNRLVRAVVPGRPDCSVVVAESCSVERPGLEDGDAEVEEARNLRLLAAAPELLEALGDALEELEDDICAECGEQWDECECPNGDWWRKARAAIRKAKGEA